MDNQESKERFFKIFPLISDRLVLSIRSTWASKGLNTHIIIDCQERTFPERIAIALCLGSDPLREALALIMHEEGILEPSVLFRPPEDYKNY